MNNEILLIYAAKAAGITSKAIGYNTLTGLKFDNNNSWNPLTDDACAFKLMAQLDMMSMPVFTQIIQDEVNNGLGLYSATRRAIVRIAAQIGAQLI